MSVEWSADTYLTWDNFEADPNPGEYQDALATIRYGCTWQVYSHNEPSSTYFVINNIQLSTLFVKNLSWVRVSAADDRLLNHVQGCFDLAEEIRPGIAVNLDTIVNEKRYPLRGGGQDEQKQNAMHDSRIILGYLDRLRRDILYTQICTYESDTNYGENMGEQAKYDKRLSLLRA